MQSEYQYGLSRASKSIVSLDTRVGGGTLVASLGGLRLLLLLPAAAATVRAIRAVAAQSKLTKCNCYREAQKWT